MAAGITTEDKAEWIKQRPATTLVICSKLRPIYVSFVSKAILWDRGVCNYTVHDRPVHRPSPCPRFLSHMKASPENFHPHCFLTSKSRQSVPSQGRMRRTRSVPVPSARMLEGHLNSNPGRKQSGAQNVGLVQGRRSAVVVPCLQLPATPPPSSLSPTPPQQNTPHSDSGSQLSKLITIPSPVSCPPPHPSPPQEKDEDSGSEKVQQPALVEPDSELNLWPGGSTRSASPTSLSHGSFSDLSRPPSSLFSRSTDLASGRSSALSDNTPANIIASDREGSVCFTPPQLSSVMQVPLVSYSSAGSNLRRSSENTITTTPAQDEPLCGQPKPTTPGIHPKSEKPESSRSRKTTKTPHLDTPADPSLNLSLSCDQGDATFVFPSTTWSSCPSPQRTTPHSWSGAKLTPSLPASRLESHRWPVMPPISPVRGGTAASHCSELSCSQSHMFDELEAIAPLSTSCLSLDQPSDSSATPSHDTDLSPGLAALTLGCDSGNLGSLSRVQLLLLDRQVPETLLSPSALEEAFSPVQEWLDEMMQYDDPGDLRPLTAGSISVRYDSAEKVYGNRSDWSDGGSGSPSSWIMDPSPSFDMLRSSYSSFQSKHSTRIHDGSPTEEEPNYPGRSDQVQRRPESPDHRAVEKDRRMEERKTKVLNILSKLQDNTPRQSKTNKSHSNFEDFDFLAKYCIFSQEKLAEYKRAFEAEDSDGDGYISCLQVLLALKTIIPPELLSDEEEIHVYRILEMVDFRVTDGLVDLRLFAVIASLAQKIASMDEFMRSLIANMDFRSLEVRLFKAKQLFLFLLEEQQGDVGAQQGFISGEQLLLELKAGGIHLEQEAAIRLELQRIPPLDLLDFLAYLPLFMLIHKSVISNPLDDAKHL
ncbi:uncharacterized protein PAE49_009251 isoform 2-T2 [Odontesthes bonariensis]